MMDFRLAALLLGLAVAADAAALDFRSIAEATLLYDAPSAKAQPLFAIARGTPVELVVTLDAWVKVRDVRGDLAWIEKRLLADRRMVMVREGRAQIRSQGGDQAPLVFEADKDVLLELVEGGNPPGWARVRHRGGQEGYVKAAQVWGL